MSFNLTDLMEQAQKMQEQLIKIKDGLKTKTTETEIQGGAIKITCNGHQEIQKIYLDPKVFPLKNREELENLLVKGINQAVADAKVMAQEELAKITGGLNLPGLKDLF